MISDKSAQLIINNIKRVKGDNFKFRTKRDLDNITLAMSVDELEYFFDQLQIYVKLTRNDVVYIYKGSRYYSMRELQRKFPKELAKSSYNAVYKLNNSYEHKMNYNSLQKKARSYNKVAKIISIVSIVILVAIIMLIQKW